MLNPRTWREVSEAVAEWLYVRGTVVFSMPKRYAPKLENSSMHSPQSGDPWRTVKIDAENRAICATGNSGVKWFRLEELV